MQEINIGQPQLLSQGLYLLLQQLQRQTNLGEPLLRTTTDPSTETIPDPVLHFLGVAPPHANLREADAAKQRMQHRETLKTRRRQTAPNRQKQQQQQQQKGHRLQQGGAAGPHCVVFVAAQVADDEASLRLPRLRGLASFLRRSREGDSPFLVRLYCKAGKNTTLNPKP